MREKTESQGLRGFQLKTEKNAWPSLRWGRLQAEKFWRRSGFHFGHVNFKVFIRDPSRCISRWFDMSLESWEKSGLK